jgi:hypothetical protein
VKRREFITLLGSIARYQILHVMALRSYSVILLSTLIATPAAAVCKSPKNICKHITSVCIEPPTRTKLLSR